MISKVEHDRLELVYRRILAEEDHWISDARRSSRLQTCLYPRAWLVVVATTLLVWLAREELSPTVRWLAPLTGTLCLLGMVIGSIDATWWRPRPSSPAPFSPRHPRCSPSLASSDCSSCNRKA